MASEFIYPTKSNGKLRIMLDVEDTEYLFGVKWLVNKRWDGECTLYSQKSVAGKPIRTYLHRLIANKHVPRPSPRHIVLIFRNGNPYDLTRANLVWITEEERNARRSARAAATRAENAADAMRRDLLGL